MNILVNGVSFYLFCSFNGCLLGDYSDKACENKADSDYRVRINLAQNLLSCFADNKVFSDCSHKHRNFNPHARGVFIGS